MADRYSFDDHLFAPGISRLLARARPQVGERVLDLAAGSAIAGRHCGRAVGRAGLVAAFDVGPNILKKARSLYAAPAPAVWVRGDAAALPFADATFDLLVCHQGLQFFADRSSAVGHMRRVLRPGGRAVVMTWTALEDCPFYLALHAAVLRHLGAPAAGFVEQPFSLPTAEVLSALFTPCFATVDITRIVVETVHPSPEAFAAAFLGYLPAALAAWEDVVAATPDVARAVAEDLAPWCVGRELRAPIPAHVILCS